MAGSGKLKLEMLSFFLFIIAGVLYLTLNLLGILDINANWLTTTLRYAKDILIACLFIIVGVVGWRHAKGMDGGYKLVYILCALIVLAAVVIPFLKG